MNIPPDRQVSCVDSDVYCLAVEMGSVTYHRFSREDFLAMGFRL